MAEMESGAKQGRDRWNPGTLPPPGDKDCGWFFKTQCWEPAKTDKIMRLGLHTRWDQLHDQFRGRRKRATTPSVGINYLFKAIKSFASTLTEKHPVAEVQSDDGDEMQTKALNEEIQLQWNEQEMQSSLYASSINMGVYGTTTEKGFYSTETNTASVKLRDPYSIFPAPGYKMCDMGLPYICEAAYLDPWYLREVFQIPENVVIPTTTDEELAGKDRETARSGSKGITSPRHYPSNYADVSESGAGRGKALVVEIWIRDKSKVKEPIIEEQPIGDDFGRPVGTQQVQTGEWVRDVYPGGIRKVTICPEMDERFCVLDDCPNPNINWKLVNVRREQYLQQGIPAPCLDENGAPVMDPHTGQPIEPVEVDPQTGMPMGFMSVSPEEAYNLALETVKKTYLYRNFPYSATPAEIDTSQWWGFSYIEVLEELQGAIQMLLDKYFKFILKQMFPILINPANSGVANSAFNNDIGLIIRPNNAASPLIRYVDPPRGPTEILSFVQFLLLQFDMVSQSPDVAEGRKPKGISAASAIVALQDKAGTLMIPYIRQIDKLIRNRGRMMISMIQNFGTEEKPVKVDSDIVTLTGIDLLGEYDYKVESGSSAPITKAGRREQYIQLFQLGAMDLESLLEALEIPRAEIIVERLTQQNSLLAAIDILVQAGLPEQSAQQLYAFLMQSQGGTGRGKTGAPGEQQSEPSAEGQQPTGPPRGASPGMRSAFGQMRTGAV